MTVVAAFDFDGTLSVRDCVVPFLERMTGRVRLVTRILAQPRAVASAVAHRDRDRVKAIAVRAAFTGRDVAAIDRLGDQFARVVHDGWLRTDTTRRLAWHQQQGHRVVLVSASLGAYLRPLGRLLGVDDVLCTEVVVGPDGCFTGELVGGNCRGPEKLRRLRDWQGEMQLGGAELWAYGDSDGDRELLAAASRPFFVKGTDVPAVPEAV